MEGSDLSTNAKQNNLEVYLVKQLNNISLKQFDAVEILLEGSLKRKIIFVKKKMFFEIFNFWSDDQT